MFPFVRIQEGLPVLQPPPVANLLFDVDILSVVAMLVPSGGKPYVWVAVTYKMQHNAPQDLEECEYELTFSFVTGGHVVKIGYVKKKIKKWVAGSWTTWLRAPRIDIELSTGMFLVDNVKNKGIIEFSIDGKFEYLIPMQFSKTKNMTGNGTLMFR